MQQDQQESNKVQEQMKSLIHMKEPTHIPNPIVKGYDFNKGLDYKAMFESYRTMGIQSTQLALAMDQVMNMINYRSEEGDRCTIFLGYTSNMISCGNREIIRYLCQHKMVDCIVTTGGAIEEDFIKCLGNLYIGSFNVDDKEFRKQRFNRIGNMFLPSSNYEKFEDWLQPIFEEMYKSQKEEGKIWSPSSMVKLMGERINNEESVYYWCAKNDIPVFCPAIIGIFFTVDGAIGDMLFANSYKNEGFILDTTQDLIKINRMALNAKKSGALVLGGGLVKHHIMNANIWRNGADFGVFINTAIEYDCSDAGAHPSEAISWGKLQMEGSHVKVYAEASLVFPILVGETFVKHKDIAKRV